jgi:CubicO group peptidase (beta-lactamase class C family)
MRSADLGMISLFVRARSASGRIGMPEEFTELERQLDAVKIPLILLSFGDPYAVAEWTAPRAVLCAYSDAEVMIEAAVAALFGDRPVTGKAPVAIPPLYQAGAGITLGTVLPPGDDTLHGADAPPGMGAVDRLMQEAVRDSVFPGAQLMVVRGNAMILNRCYGRLTYDPASRAVDDSTMYDLASLTKVVATTPAVMKLCDDGELDLDAAAAELLPQFAAGAKRGVTVRLLLLHRAGFPPFRKLWDLATTPAAALDSALMTPLVARPGDTTIYSDLGMIALGRIVQCAARLPLDAYVREEFFMPLGMRSTLFNPPGSLRGRVAPTEDDTLWRRTLVRGSVHDENAYLLGGVSGHAGLFSTASDLARYAAMLLNGGVYAGVEYLSAGTIREFLGARAEGQERWLGWDMKSAAGSSAGSLFSRSSFGHTGFTGTSLWIDPDRRLAVILLSNRVYPTRANNRIIRFRPLLHDAIVRALG